MLLLPIPLILPSGTFKSSIRCNLGGHLSSSSSVLSILTERFTHIEGAISTGDGSEGARMPPPQLIKEFDWPRRSASSPSMAYRDWAGYPPPLTEGVDDD